jgi:hypothetical protein
MAPGFVSIAVRPGARSSGRAFRSDGRRAYRRGRQRTISRVWRAFACHSPKTVTIASSMGAHPRTRTRHEPEVVVTSDLYDPDWTQRHVCLDSGEIPAPPARVAQWLEPAAHNGLVAGSSPAGPTSPFNHLAAISTSICLRRHRYRHRYVPFSFAAGRWPPLCGIGRRQKSEEFVPSLFAGMRS